MTHILEKSSAVGWIVLDGVLLPEDQAFLSCKDNGLLLGCTVFDSFVVHEGRVVGLSMHLERLARSAETVGFDCPTAAILREELGLLLDHCDGSFRVRITLSEGGSRMVWAQAFDRNRIHRSVTAGTCPHPGFMFLPGWVKHGSRFGSTFEKKRRNVDVLLYTDPAGHFMEGCTAGIVTERDGVLYTAPHTPDILPSVTVHSLAERAKKANIPWQWSAPRSDSKWDAIYVASSGRDLSPVVLLNGLERDGWAPAGKTLAASWSPLDGELIRK